MGGMKSSIKAGFCLIFDIDGASSIKIFTLLSIFVWVKLVVPKSDLFLCTVLQPSMSRSDLDEQQQTKSNERMTLHRASITTIKSNLSNALSAKDPHGIASAVDLPSLPTRVLGPSGGGHGNSQQQHQEYLKIDGVDWSNVLNPLLDAHSAIQSVCDQHYFDTYY